MSWNFDQCPDRRGTGSLKWERWAGQDVLPLWVADMDVAAPEPVLAALRRRLEHPVLGYTNALPSFAEAACAFLERRYGWTVAPEAIVPVSGVVSGFHQFIRAIGQAGDGHLCPVPAYHHFLPAPGLHGQRLLRVPLSEGPAGFTLEDAALAAATDATTRGLLFCHPHNPTGRLWNEGELRRIAAHCLRHDLWLCSDEIWADLTLDAPHRPFAAAAPEIAARTVTLLAPSKTFNIPGLACAIAVIEDAALRRKFNHAGHGIVPYVNLLGLAAAEAAWRDCDDWLEALRAHLRRNRALVGDALARLPRLRWHTPEATYLAWIDARGTRIADPAAHALAHGLGLSDGRDFGAPGWLRLNFACPRLTLEAALERLTNAFA